jgi:hypothetical protein
MIVPAAGNQSIGALLKERTIWPGQQTQQAGVVGTHVPVTVAPFCVMRFLYCLPATAQSLRVFFSSRERMRHRLRMENAAGPARQTP